MSDYSKMTQHDFDRILETILSEMKASELLSIPGVYEEVSEVFNNEVLIRWEEENESEEGGKDEF